jgi:ATP-dependent DNA ligase
LRRLIPSVPTRLLYVDHVQARGKDFFEVACAHDLEGIVGKLASGRYYMDGTSTNWCKIKNPAYTQMTVRHELFERKIKRRKRIPMLRVHKWLLRPRPVKAASTSFCLAVPPGLVH